MRTKPPIPARPALQEQAVAEPALRKSTPVDRHRERIHADLRRRGVAAEFSASICDRLAPFFEDLTPELYDAVLSGVAMAYGVHRRGVESSRANGPSVREVERLMGGFVSELRKLDETLETLAAYVTRLRTQTGPDDTLH